MDIIQQVLGTQYAMFYCDKFDCAKLTPLQTLSMCIDTVNAALRQHGNTLDQWSEFFQNRAAKLVRANYIYQRLSVEPIRKPILAHKENDKFIVDCGDTRLMALNQLLDPAPVSVIITCSIDVMDQYQDWVRIRNVTDLSTCTGFDLDGNRVKLATVAPELDYALCWLEFADHSTAHHLHDPQQRLNMMQRYLDQQPQNFQFDNNWVLKEINW